MNRVRLSLIIAFLLPTATWADSWCGFDQGFIGTQATGYVFPSALGGYVAPDTTKQPIPDPICKVQTYTSPSGEALKTLDCIEFQHTPSAYVDDPSAFEPPAGPLPLNGYFTLMVFATKDRFVQLRLKDNTPIWAKIENTWSVNGIGQGGVFPANQIFSKPDRAFPAPPSLTPSDPMMRKKIRALLGSNTPITADFVYTNTQEVPAKDGTTWLKAEERFQWDKYCCGDENMVSPSKKFEAPSGSESYWTEPLRTVYIPVRDADGTLLNVAGYGNLYCD